jgi:hypothetical protein
MDTSMKPAMIMTSSSIGPVQANSTHRTQQESTAHSALLKRVSTCVFLRFFISCTDVKSSFAKLDLCTISVVSRGSTAGEIPSFIKMESRTPAYVTILHVCCNWWLISTHKQQVQYGGVPVRIILVCISALQDSIIKCSISSVLCRRHMLPAWAATGSPIY